MANNVVQFNPKALPAHLKRAEPSALTNALAGGAASGKRLSIKGGVFRLVVDGKELAAIEERYLDVVIVNAAPKIGRTWYAKAYDGDTAQAPDCWSSDGDVPDPTSAKKQSDKCSTCKQNIKGSGANESKACRYSQRIAVVLANDMEGNVLQLSVPALSLFGKEEGDNRPLQAYAKWLREADADVGALITRLKFDMKSESPKLYFKAMRWLEESEYQVCVAQGKTDDAVKAITMTVAALDKPQDVVEEAPATVAPKKQEPAATPADDTDDEPPPPPPKKAAATKSGAKKAAAPADEEAPPPEPKLRTDAKAPVPASNLAAVVQNWGDD